MCVGWVGGGGGGTAGGNRWRRFSEKGRGEERERERRTHAHTHKHTHTRFLAHTHNRKRGRVKQTYRDQCWTPVTTITAGATDLRLHYFRGECSYLFLTVVLCAISLSVCLSACMSLSLTHTSKARHGLILAQMFLPAN